MHLTWKAVEMDATWALVGAATLAATLMISTGLIQEFIKICRAEFFDVFKRGSR
jgi:hypothetical protein